MVILGHKGIFRSREASASSNRSYKKDASFMYDKIVGISNAMADDAVSFARKLIQTPSLSGEEKQVADHCMAEMIKLDYDDVFSDQAGNVIGIIKGSGTGKNIMFNSHMDHVDPGEPKNWEYEPYGAVISDGYIHGRAACDDKGGMASQIYAGAVLKKLGALKGDFIFSAVVQEETTEMFGMRYLCDRTCPEKGIQFDLMVSSEATNLNIYLGHRGRVEVEVMTLGQTSHASTPERGINAVYKMVPLIAGIQEIAAQLPSHQFLGKSTLVLTNITCSPGRLSILPDVCTISLDRRLIPGETIEQVMEPIKKIITQLSKTDPKFKAVIRIKKVKETSYTGYSEEVEKYMDPWLIDQNHEYIQSAVRSLKAVGQNPGFGKWDFATDASYVTRKGIPAIGYSPMEEQYAHTPFDRVKVDSIIRAIAGNAAIAVGFCGF
jgi:putative selenium metabolism hydrolase